MVDELRGAEPAGRRGRLLVLAALVVLLLGAGADRWAAQREADRLLDAVAAGEAVVAASRGSQTGLADYSSRLLTGADVPPAARAAAYDNLATDARRWLVRLERPEARVDGTAVLPWHGDLRAARTAYARRLDAWRRVLEQVAADPAGEGRDLPAVRAARDEARAALLAVADRERVTALLGGEGGRAPGR